MTTPEYGTMYFKGASGRTYAIDVYHPDAAGLVCLDGGGGASSTSPTYWNAPEFVTLYDYSVATGQTVVAKLSIIANAVPTGIRLRFANHLNSLNNRPALAISFNKGTQISAMEEVN